MNLPDPSPISRAIHRAFGYVALFCLVALLIVLTSCTLCPHEQCPVIIEAHR